MKKKFVIALLALTLASSSIVYAADATDNAATESVASDSATEETSEYDLTEAETDELVKMVKDKITAQYLDVYQIDPATFTIPAYVPVTYDKASADNPWSDVRVVLQGGIINPDVNLNTEVSVAIAAGLDDMGIDSIKGYLENGDLTFKDTFQEQAPQMYEAITGSNPEQAALIGAIYEGIAEFLNSLDTDRCAEVLFARKKAVIEAGEDENYAELQTMFDPVIEKNISFE